MTGPAGERARVRLGRVALAALAGMLLCTALAWWDARTGFSGAAAFRLLQYSGFLVFDLAAIVAGATLAALRRSAAWATLPAFAVANTFLMLILAFNAWETIRV